MSVPAISLHVPLHLRAPLPTRGLVQRRSLASGSCTGLIVRELPGGDCGVSGGVGLAIFPRRAEEMGLDSAPFSPGPPPQVTLRSPWVSPLSSWWGPPRSRVGGDHRRPHLKRPSGVDGGSRRSSRL